MEGVQERRLSISSPSATSSNSTGGKIKTEIGPWIGVRHKLGVRTLEKGRRYPTVQKKGRKRMKKVELWEEELVKNLTPFSP